MSKKCNKVKNPCKICLGVVTQKTGLQCQGACQCWVHYSCLNYTPGKIKDIKAGIIKVTCPCPDCKTSQPKEYRTDQPYSCNNAMCPANRPPKCENNQCPINDVKTAPKNMGGGAGPTERPACALNKCGKSDCKQFSSPHTAPKPKLVSNPPCKPDPCDPNQLQKCPSGCSSTNDMSGDFGKYQGGAGTGMGALPPMNVVEQMCNTVGELTNQIQQLMYQMKKAVDDRQQESGPRPPHPPLPCPTHVPKSSCPKPCFCPGNPGRRS